MKKAIIISICNVLFIYLISYILYVLTNTISPNWWNIPTVTLLVALCFIFLLFTIREWINYFDK